MKKYKVTVNGQSYEVEVEELGGEVSAETVKTNPAAQPTVRPVVAKQPKADNSKPAPAPKATVDTAGKTTVEAPMPGTILTIKAKPGAQVSEGDVIMILEAMKMENEILASKDGKVVSIETTEGASVDTGDLLAVIE